MPLWAKYWLLGMKGIFREKHELLEKLEKGDELADSGLFSHLYFRGLFQERWQTRK